MIKNYILLSFICLLAGFSVFAQGESPELLDWIEKNRKALKVNDTAAIIKSYKYMGDGYSDLENRKKSDNCLKLGLNWSIKSHNDRETGILYNLLANNASYSGDRDLAFVYYKRALKAFAKVRNLPKMAMIQMNIGTEYANVGDYPNAIAWELKALRTKRASGDTENLGYFYQKVGELFKDTNLDKWEFYVKKAYQLKRVPDAVSASTGVAIFNDLGGIAHKRKKYKEAYAWYDSMFVRSKAVDYDLGMSTALSNRCLVLKDENRLDEALATILQSIKISEQTGRRFSMIVDNIHASSILLDLKRPAEARLRCLKALNLAKQDHAYPEQEADAYRLLAEIEEATGNWKQAFEYQRAHHYSVDSIHNTEVNETVEALEAKFQSAEKEKRINKLDLENQVKDLRLARTKVMIFALVVFILIIGFTVFFWYRKKRILHLKHQADLKQKLLRSQMNPHFLFNTLNSINFFIQSNQSKLASDYLAQYAKLMRQILENSAVEFIPLETEISFIRNYLSMEQLRYNNNFTYSLLVDEALDCEMVELPPMLSQPIIENAVEHGFRDMKSGGQLTIEFTRLEKKLVLIVTDNGSGYNPKLESSLKDSRRSFAMDITRERLAFLGGKGNALCIESPVDTTQKGTRVTITIPFK